jgi:hypothetical protein
MGQKSNPIGIRKATYKRWNNKDFLEDYNYSSVLHQNIEIERYIKSFFNLYNISFNKCVVKRVNSEVYIYIYYFKDLSQKKRVWLSFKRTKRRKKVTKKNNLKINKYISKHSTLSNKELLKSSSSKLTVKNLILNSLINLLQTTQVKVKYINVYKSNNIFLNNNVNVYKGKKLKNIKDKNIKQSFWKVGRNLGFGRIRTINKKFLTLFYNSIITKNFDSFLDELSFLLRSYVRKPQPLFNYLNKLFLVLGPKLNVKGLQLQFKGRFNNATRTKVRTLKYGKIPLQTLDAKILYGMRHVFTIYGVCSIKFWLYI